MIRKLPKIIYFLVCFLLIFEQSGFAQIVGQLDISGYIANLHNALTIDKFRPLHLRYLQYDATNNSFRLLIDKGDRLKGLSPKGTVPRKELEDTSKELMKYFFIGLALPNDAFWVNLRPDAENNIINEQLAQTDVGKILLESDLQLKKDTAKFTSPETPEGKEYWDKLYQKATEIFGSQNITIPTLTRPWIVPDEIIIRETTDSAYIYKATLKVMLEQDYLKDSGVYNFKDDRLKELNEYSSQLIRELIIPKLTKEINTSKRYASLRQVYYSLILASWFKARFSAKDGLYSRLIDRKILTNLTSKEDWSKTTYFQAYQKSFKDGEYNYQTPVYTPYGQTVRSYFSGGIIPCVAPQAIADFGGTPRVDPKTGAKITSAPAQARIPQSDTVAGVNIQTNAQGDIVHAMAVSAAQNVPQRDQALSLAQLEEKYGVQIVILDGSSFNQKARELGMTNPGRGFGYYNGQTGQSAAYILQGNENDRTLVIHEITEALARQSNAVAEVGGENGVAGDKGEGPMVAAKLIEANETLSIIMDDLKSGKIVIFGDMHRGERRPKDDEIWDHELFLDYIEQLGRLSMNFSVALELPHQLEAKVNNPSVSAEDFLDEYYKLLAIKYSTELARGNIEIQGPYLSRLLSALKRFNIPVILVDDIDSSRRGGLFNSDLDTIEQSNKDMVQKLLEGRKKYSNDSILLMVGRSHVVSNIHPMWLNGRVMNSIPGVLLESKASVKLVRPDDLKYDREDLAKFDLIIKVDGKRLKEYLVRQDRAGAQGEDHAAGGVATREDVEQIALVADALGIQGRPLPQDIIDELEKVFGPGRTGNPIVYIVPQAQMITRDTQPINGPVRLGNKIFVGDKYFAQYNKDFRVILADLGHEAMAQWIAERRPDLNNDAHSLANELAKIIGVSQREEPAAEPVGREILIYNPGTENTPVQVVTIAPKSFANSIYFTLPDKTVVRIENPSGKRPMLLTKDIIRVSMYQYAITNADSSYPLIATTSAGPCFILTLYDPISRIGFLTHLTYLPSRDFIDTILTELQRKGVKDIKNLRARIMGGYEQVNSASKYYIYLALRDKGVQFIESEKNTTAARSAILDTRTGEVFDVALLSDIDSLGYNKGRDEAPIRHGDNQVLIKSLPIGLKEDDVHDILNEYLARKGVVSSPPVDPATKEKDNDFGAPSSKAPGGIDFRSLPIVTQAIGNLSVNINHSSMSQLASVNLHQEWQDIERMVSAGITPSSERIKEYLQASCAKGEVGQDVDKVISCISEILRQEEESCFPTEAVLRDILVVLESSRSSAELSQVFLGKSI